MSNLQTYYHFKLDFQKVEASGNPRHQTPQSYDCPSVREETLKNMGRYGFINDY